MGKKITSFKNVKSLERTLKRVERAFGKRTRGRLKKNGTSHFKQKRGETMKQATSLQPVNIQVVVPRNAFNQEAFVDNLGHIQFLVSEVSLWLAAAYMRLKGQEQPGDAHLVKEILGEDGGAVNSENELQEKINSMARQRLKMEKQAESKGVKLRFVELADKYSLDTIEQKILQLCLVADTSLEFRAIFEKCDIDFWRDGFRGGTLEVGAAVPDLANQPAI